MASVYRIDISHLEAGGDAIDDGVQEATKVF